MLFIFPRRKINVFSLKLFPLKVGESYTYKRENLLFQLTSETPLLLSSKKRATRLLFAFSLPLSFSPLHSVVTISKWNNEKKGRCEMGGDISSSARLRNVSWHRYSKSWQLSSRRNGGEMEGQGQGWSEKEASVNRYRFTRALHA